MNNELNELVKQQIFQAYAQAMGEVFVLRAQLQLAQKEIEELKQAKDEKAESAE